jgi:PEP-CTERM motif
MNAKFLAVLALGAMVCAAPAADAAPLLFNFSGPSGTAVFTLDSNPTPDYVHPLGLPGSDQFGFNNVAGIYDGVAGVASTINFGEGLDASLNILAPGLGFTQFAGLALFTGTAYNPIFTPGTYTLPNAFLGNGTLTISSVAGVPEPGVWAMMIAGLGMMGAAMRSRKRDVVAAV